MLPFIQLQYSVDLIKCRVLVINCQFSSEIVTVKENEEYC